ncbi:MAG TPA: nickel pincer cofactor biosynthesis protein LarC [Magnetospirillaceae bacterium]|jgi:hypothetical protein
MARRPSLILLDPVGGISGDMFVAAMLDAFPDLAEPTLDAVRRCGLPQSCKVKLVERQSNGLAAAGFMFEGDAASPSGAYPDFRRRLKDAPLSETVRARALAILELLGQAEASVHRTPIEQVHFHELADWDTQADIVAAAAIIDQLGEVRWRYRPLPLGSGMVKTAHGLLPVPAPATAHLLEGFAVRDDGIPGERVTPTGAAILRYLVPDAETTSLSGHLVAKGSGAGTKRFPGLPNILRVLAFAEEMQSSDSVMVIEFDIDDQSPEDLATGLDKLRAVSGVRDVVTFTGIGKKGRWVHAVRVMADPAARAAVVETIFNETTTLGLRVRQEERAIVPRRAVTVDDVTGPVRVKIAERPKGETAKAEANDIARADGADGRSELRDRAERHALKTPEGTS